MSRAASIKDGYTTGVRSLAARSIGGLARTRVTPNALTASGVLLCAAASIVVLFENRHELTFYWLGAFLFVAGSVLDILDGALARKLGAHEVFAHLGAERELDATREQLRELGARPPSRSQTQGIAGLTGRELEIVRLVAARRSNKEIGTALGISARTASTHLSNIFSKLGVDSRGELADLAREVGLLDVSS